MENLTPLFIALTGAAVVLQAGLLAAMYLALRKTSARVEAIGTEVKTKAKKTDMATAIGKLAAEKAKAAGITKVVFDRGGYQYHGRVKALADAARAAGLEF